MGFDPYLLAVPGLDTLQPYQPGKPVEDLQRELGLKNIIKLASNENPLGCSPAVTQALSEVSQLSRYPDAGAYRLKAALSAHLDVAENQLTIGNGSNEVLELLVKAFINPDDKVIISQHAFAVYYLASKAAGAQIDMVPSINWGHDLVGISNQVDEQTKMLFIANPNNPTGTHLEFSELKTFLERIPESVIVVVDEAYVEYASASVLALLPNFPNLVITRTFSKAYGLAAFRVGYGVCSPQIAGLLNRVRQPFNTSSYAQAAALAALSDQAFVNETVALNVQQKKRLYDGFDKLGRDYIASHGNFVSVHVGDEKAVYEKMLHQGVIVRPLGAYQMPGYLRFTTGLEQENQAALTALEKAL